jgi:DNA-binding transcriptional ArsR family regulator
MDERLLAALKALADASRLRIVGLLAKQPRSVDELSAALAITPATASHHLSKLAKAGHVSARAEQYYSVYSLVEGALDALGQRFAASEEDAALLAATADESAYERETLARYVRNGETAFLPSGLKKQRIVLGWVCEPPTAAGTGAPIRRARSRRTFAPSSCPSRRMCCRHAA